MINPVMYLRGGTSKASFLVFSDRVWMLPSLSVVENLFGFWENKADFVDCILFPIHNGYC